MGWGVALSVLWRLVRGVSRSSIADTADRLLDRLAALSDAKTDEERAKIEREIVQLKAIHDLQKPSAGRWWSPMALGQYLIVLPFGMWWAAVCLVSIADPYVEMDLDVQALPSNIFDMAWWLIPVIVAGTVLGRRL